MFDVSRIWTDGGVELREDFSYKAMQIYSDQLGERVSLRALRLHSRSGSFFIPDIQITNLYCRPYCHLIGYADEQDKT